MFQLPPTPKHPWAVDFLTTDYLISGSIDGDDTRRAFQISGDNFSQILVTGARIQPTGSLAAPDSVSAPWAVVYGDNLVAVIPRDQASLDYAQKQNSGWRNPQPAEVVVGNYLIRGTVLSPDRQVTIFATYTAAFVAQQVQITSLLPGGRLTGLTAPFAMIYGRHKHFVRPA